MIANQDKIIEGLKNGDKAIFELVYREYYTQLVYYSVKYVETIEDAEGLVQELFVKLWGMHSSLNVNTSLNAYLYRAAQNYALNFLKKKKKLDRHVVVDNNIPIDYDDDGLKKLENSELRLILKSAILELPEKRRKIFELSRFEGYKYAKIANELSISVKTVEAQMTKALKYLRVVLKDYATVIIAAWLIISTL